jgi:hypothetical protein
VVIRVRSVPPSGMTSLATKLGATARATFVLQICNHMQSRFVSVFGGDGRCACLPDPDVHQRILEAAVTMLATPSSPIRGLRFCPILPKPYHLVRLSLACVTRYSRQRITFCFHTVRHTRTTCSFDLIWVLVRPRG